jgi:D-3-phosphoglycerate dehydrogenase
MQEIIYLGPGEAFHVAEEILDSSRGIVALELTREAVAEYMPSAVAILDASMKVRFDESLLSQAPKLRVISTATTGADHIDTKALSQKNISLFTLAGENQVLRNLTPAAELSWALLMACARGLRAAVRHVLEGNWVREEFPGIMLKGKTLGLIGCGRIGCWMARYAHAFDMEIIGYDPLLDVWPDHIRCVDLECLLARADFISIHVPLTEQTRGMIGAREFGLMKAGVVFINTSRGGLIDERAFLRSLESGRMGAAGVDVLEGEPNINQHALVDYARKHDNLIVTPHIGGFSPDAVKLVVAHAARRIRDFLTLATQAS